MKGFIEATMTSGYFMPKISIAISDIGQIMSGTMNPPKETASIEQIPIGRIMYRSGGFIEVKESYDEIKALIVAAQGEGER